MEKIISKIDRLIPRDKSSEAMIRAFEKIDQLMKKEKGWTLMDVGDDMKKAKHAKYRRFDRFFLDVHQKIRRAAEKSELYKENLLRVAINSFWETSKLTNPKHHDSYGFWPVNYDVAHAAYQHTLDQYEPRKGKWYHLHWSGYWSLISTKNGKVTGCYLGDTSDNEFYWGFVKKNHKKILGKKLTA